MFTLNFRFIYIVITLYLYYIHITFALYLHCNYIAFTWGKDVWIEGNDVAGWTMDGYVIPRLASGNIVASEMVDY